MKKVTHWCFFFCPPAVHRARHLQRHVSTSGWQVHYYIKSAGHMTYLSGEHWTNCWSSWQRSAFILFYFLLLTMPDWRFVLCGWNWSKFTFTFLCWHFVKFNPALILVMLDIQSPIFLDWGSGQDTKENGLQPASPSQSFNSFHDFTRWSTSASCESIRGYSHRALLCCWPEDPTMFLCGEIIWRTRPVGPHPQRVHTESVGPHFHTKKDEASCLTPGWYRYMRT